MENKILEIFIPGPAGRLEAKYFKNHKVTSPIALVLQPHHLFSIGRTQCESPSYRLDEGYKPYWNED